MFLKKNEIIKVVSAFVLGTIGIIWLLTMEDNVIPFRDLIKEYPYITTDEGFDSEVAEIYCPPRTRCPGIITMVRLSNTEKRTIQAFENVSHTVELHGVLTQGSRIVKLVGSDTLYVYSTVDKSVSKFVIDRTIGK